MLDKTQSDFETASPQLVKLAWAFTLGMTVQRYPDLNMSRECRIGKRRDLAIADECMFIINPGQPWPLMSAMERAIGQGEFWARATFRLLLRYFGNNLLEEANKVCEFCTLLLGNEHFEFCNFQDISKFKRQICKQIHKRRHTACEILTLAEMRAVDQPRPEVNFVLHRPVCITAWAATAAPTNARFVAPCRATQFPWECCSKMALGLNKLVAAARIAQNTSRSSRMTALGIAKTKREMSRRLLAWIDSHFDTKNVILIFSFAMGQVRHMEAETGIVNMDLSSLYLFPFETSKHYKYEIEMYRGKVVKTKFMDLLKGIFLPSLQVADIICLYNFCAELRRSLAEAFIHRNSMLEAHNYICSRYQQPSGSRLSFDALIALDNVSLSMFDNEYHVFREKSTIK